MTIKIKRVLEYTLSNMHSELQFAKLAIWETKDRLENLIHQRDFASYHSAEDIEICNQKLKELSEISQKINRIESDIKYFKNKSLLLYKKMQ